MTDYELQCSEEKQTFPTGAQRDNQNGKGRFDLLPPNAIQRLALHFEKGAAKYGDNNYLKGIPLSRYVDSCLRHLFTYMAGTEQDEDNLVAAAWNLVAAIETESRCESKTLPLTLIDIGPYQNIPEVQAAQRATTTDKLSFAVADTPAAR